MFVRKYIVSRNSVNFDSIISQYNEDENVSIKQHNSYAEVEVTCKFSRSDVFGTFDFVTHQSFNLSEQDIQFVIDHGTKCDCCKKSHSHRRNVVVVNNNGNKEVWGKDCFDNAQYDDLIKLITSDQNTICCNSEEKFSHQTSFSLQQVWDYVVNCRKLIVNKRNYFDETSLVSKNHQTKIESFNDYCKAHQIASNNVPSEQLIKWIDNNQWIDQTSRFPTIHAIETNEVHVDVLNSVVFVLNQYFVENAINNSNHQFEVNQKTFMIENGHLISLKVCESQLGFISTQIVFVDQNNNLFVWYKSGVATIENDLYSDRISVKGSYKGMTNLHQQQTVTLTRGKIL